MMQVGESATVKQNFHEAAKPYSIPLKNANYDVLYGGNNVMLKGETPETAEARTKIFNYTAKMPQNEKYRFAEKLGITYWNYGEPETRQMINKSSGFLDFISKMDLDKDQIPKSYYSRRYDAIEGFLAAPEVIKPKNYIKK